MSVARTQGAATSLRSVSWGADVTSYADSGLLAGTAYRYRVRVHHNGSHSAYSNVADAITPPAATGLTATIGSSTTINLAWTDVTGESAFFVERCAGSGCMNFTLISQLGANVTSFANASLTPGALYRYRVRSSNAGGSSAYSNIADATTVPPPASGLVLTVLSDDGHQAGLVGRLDGRNRLSDRAVHGYRLHGLRERWARRVRRRHTERYRP